LHLVKVDPWHFACPFVNYDFDVLIFFVSAEATQ